jgi:hypothetical protein
MIWSGKRDSNSRPRPWQGRALPTELFPRKSTSFKHNSEQHHLLSLNLDAYCSGELTCVNNDQASYCFLFDSLSFGQALDKY